MMMSDICHFRTQRLGTVVAPERCITQNSAGNSFGRILPIGLRRQFLQLAIASARLSGRGRRLIETMIAILNALPSLAVERYSKNDLFPGDAGMQKATQCIVPIALVQRSLGRISRVMEQSAMKVCGGLGVPVQVVSHDGNVIQVSADLLQFKILVVLLFRRQGGSEQISGL